jgi:hypothetical protein
VKKIMAGVFCCAENAGSTLPIAGVSVPSKKCRPKNLPLGQGC